MSTVRAAETGAVRRVYLPGVDNARLIRLHHFPAGDAWLSILRRLGELVRRNLSGIIIILVSVARAGAVE